MYYNILNKRYFFCHPNELLRTVNLYTNPLHGSGNYETQALTSNNAVSALQHFYLRVSFCCQNNQRFACNNIYVCNRQVVCSLVNTNRHL